METPNLSSIIDRSEPVNDGGTSKSSCNTVVPRNDLWYKCEHCFQAFTSVEKLGTHVARYCFMIHLFDQNGFLPVFNTVQKESDVNSSPSQAKPSTACKDKTVTSVTSMERISINAVEKKTQNTGNQENINNKGKQRGVCPICKKSFRDNVLSRHMRIHTGDMPYVCTKCSLSFSQSCSLTRHLLTHKKGEVLLDCEHCENRYRTQRDLNRHLKLHETTGAYAVESLLKCKVCSSEYRTKRGLREHEKTHPELQNVDSKGDDLKDSVTSGTDGEDENIAEITKEQKRWTTGRLPTRLCKRKKKSAKSYKKTPGQKESEAESDGDPEWKIDKAKSPCDNTEWKQKSAGNKHPAGASSKEKKQLDSVSLKTTNENSSSIVSASNNSKHVSMFRALIVTEPKKVDILSTQNNFLHSQKDDKASSLSEQRHGSIDNDLQMIHQNYNSSPANEQMDLEEQDKLSHPTETSSTSVNKDISNYRSPELSLSEAHKGKHTFKASSPLTQSEKVISLDDSSAEKDNDTPSGTEQTTANDDLKFFDPHATDPSSDAHHECENLDKSNHVKKYSIGENKKHCVLSGEKSILRKELTTEFNNLRRVPNVLTISPAQQPLQHGQEAISSMQTVIGAPSFGAIVPNFTLINLPVLVVTNPNPGQMQHPLQEIALNSLQGNIWKAPFVHSVNRIPPPVVSQLLNRQMLQKQTTETGASTMLQHRPKQNLLTWVHSSQLTTDNKLAVAAQVNRSIVLCGKCNGSYPRSLHAYRMHMRTHHPSDTLSEGHQGNITKRKQVLQSKSCEPPELEDSEPSLEGHQVNTTKRKQALQSKSCERPEVEESESSLEGHQDSESLLEGHRVKTRKRKQALQLQSRKQATVGDSESSLGGHQVKTRKLKQASLKEYQGYITKRKQAIQSKSCEPPEVEDSESSLEGHQVKARKRKQALQLQSRRLATVEDSDSSSEGHQGNTTKRKQALQSKSCQPPEVEDSESSLEGHQVKARKRKLGNVRKGHQGNTTKRKQALQSKSCEPPEVEDSESSLEGHQVKARKRKQALQLQSRRQATVEDSDSSSEGHQGNTTKRKQALQSKSCEPPEVEDSESSSEGHQVRARKRKQALQLQLQSRKQDTVEDSELSLEGHQGNTKKRKQALQSKSCQPPEVENSESSLEGHQVKTRKRKQALQLQSRKRAKVVDLESSLEGHQCNTTKRKQALQSKSCEPPEVEDSESSLEGHQDSESSLGHQVRYRKRKHALQLKSRKQAKVETSESDTESDTDLTSEPSTDAESICIDSDSDSSFMDEHVTASLRTEQCTENDRDESNAVSRQRLTRSTVSKVKGLKSTVDYREKHEEHEDDILSDVSSEDLGEKVGEKQDLVRKVMTGSVEYCGEKGMEENVSNETEMIAQMKTKVARVRLVKLKLQDNVDHGPCFIKQEREGISTECNQSEWCELSPTTPETTFVATSYQSIRVKQEMMDFQSEMKDAVCDLKPNLSGADTRLQRHGINSSSTEFTLQSNSKSKELPSSIKSEPVDHEQDSCNHASAELPTLVMTSPNRCEGQERHSKIPGPTITSRVSIKNEQDTVQELASRPLVRNSCVLPSDCNIVDGDTNCNVAINVKSETEVMDNNRNAVVVTAKRDVTSQPSPEPVDENDLMNDEENDTSSNDDMETEVIVNNTSQDAGTNNSNSVSLALPLIKPDGLTGEALSVFTRNPNIVIKTEPLEISTVDVSKHSAVDHPQSIENISPCVPLIDHVRGSVGNAATWNDIGSEATITKVKREPLREEEPNDSSCSYYTPPCSTTELNPSGALSERMFLSKYDPISDDDECQMNNQTRPSIGSSDSAVLDQTSGHSNVCRLSPNIFSVPQGTKTPYLPPVEQDSTFTPNYQTEMGLQSLHSHGLSMSPSLAEIGIADPSGFSKSSGYNGAVGAPRYNPSVDNNVLYEQLLPIHRTSHSGNSLHLVQAHPQNHIDANINIPSNVSNRPAESRLCTTKVGSVHGLPAERFQTFYNSVGDSYVGSLAESSGLQQMFIGCPAGYQVQPSNSNPYGFHPNIANHDSNFDNCDRNVGYFASGNQTMNYQSGFRWPLHIQ